MQSAAGPAWMLVVACLMLAAQGGCCGHRGFTLTADWSFQTHHKSLLARATEKWQSRHCGKCGVSGCEDCGAKGGGASDCGPGGCDASLHGEMPPEVEHLPAPGAADLPHSLGRFHPVPTRPVFGPDAPQGGLVEIRPMPIIPPEGDEKLQPLDEPTPAPPPDPEPVIDEPPEFDLSAAGPRLGQAVQTAGWRGVDAGRPATANIRATFRR